MDASTPLDRLRSWLAQDGPSLLGPYGNWIIFGAVILAGLIALRIVMHRLLGGKRPIVDPERGLGEDLATYPPAPGTPGPRRLTVQEVPVRVRLVVVAPVGKQSSINEDAIDGLLDQLVRGLGAIVQQDKPRVRVWPAQLSNRGFAPTFRRLVERPEAEGQPSHWVLVAGHAKVGNWPLLLGFACWADQATTLGHVTVEADRWRDALRIQSLES